MTFLSNQLAKTLHDLFMLTKEDGDVSKYKGGSMMSVDSLHSLPFSHQLLHFYNYTYFLLISRQL